MGKVFKNVANAVRGQRQGTGGTGGYIPVELRGQNQNNLGGTGSQNATSSFTQADMDINQQGRQETVNDILRRRRQMNNKTNTVFSGKPVLG